MQLKWSAALGSGSYREPHIQVLEMPPKAFEHALRLRPNLIQINWSGSRFNSHLFDIDDARWKIASSRILRSLSGKRTIRRLGNEFGIWKGNQLLEPTLSMVKVLDAMSNLSYLANLEQDKYLQYMKLTREETQTILSDLVKKGAVDIIYAPNLTDLLTVSIIGQGPVEHVCSLGRGLLRYTPSSTVMIGKDGKWIQAMTRMPASIAHQIMALLPSVASEYGVTLRCNRTTSFRSYAWDFYQRQLKQDGSWDDDVSGMLSQIRVPYRENDVQKA